MRQKVCNNKLGVACIFADIYFYRCAVSLYDNAVKGKRNCSPLIFFDTAVVMCFKQSKLCLFIKRIGLEVKPGRIDMSGGNAYALFNGTLADNGKDNRLAPVIIDNLISCLVACFGVKGDKTVFVRKVFNKIYNLTLNLAL